MLNGLKISRDKDFVELQRLRKENERLNSVIDGAIVLYRSLEQDCNDLKAENAALKRGIEQWRKDCEAAAIRNKENKMTDHTDLIARLRANSLADPAGWNEVHRDRLQAAMALEAQSQRIAELELENKRWTAAIPDDYPFCYIERAERAEAQRDAYKNDVTKEVDAHCITIATLNRIKAENAELRAVLNEKNGLDKFGCPIDTYRSAK